MPGPVKIRRLTLSAFGLLVATVLAVIWFGQRSLMYFPSSDAGSPADAGLSTAEVVTLRTEDDLELGAWFIPPATLPSGYTVIVFNGNAGHRGYRTGLARGLAQRGHATLLFDYRGYGGNPGLPHERGIMRDARAALAYVRARPGVDTRRIVYFGESLGTAVAVQLATEHAPAAIVLRSPFTSFVSMARVHMPWVPARWLLRDRYDSIAVIDQVTSPLLVIAGDRDSIVPFEESEALYARARGPKRFVTIDGADHNDEALTDGPLVIDATDKWLSR
jgi:fermentation-respiration switch protein FrsA (DUF1100 family)